MGEVFFGGTDDDYPSQSHPFITGPSDLERQAARLYPDSYYLRSEWMRAVAVVRSTSRGWHLDQPVERRQ
jgi:hypothetical protein